MVGRLGCDRVRAPQPVGCGKNGVVEQAVAQFARNDDETSVNGEKQDDRAAQRLGEVLENGEQELVGIRDGGKTAAEGIQACHGGLAAPRLFTALAYLVGEQRGQDGGDRKHRQVEQVLGMKTRKSRIGG